MGYELRREVRDLLAPGILTATERLILLEIADTCGDKTRIGWPRLEWIVEKCDLPSSKRAGEHLTSIARKWFEIRIELGKDKHGNAFYAAKGRAVNYRIPTRSELVLRHGAGKVPEFQGGDARKDPGNQGGDVPSFQGGDLPENQGPFSSVRTPQKEPSSLSPREDEGDAPSPVQPQPERETVDASQEEPKITNPIHLMLIKNGCPAEQVEHVKNRIDTIRNVQSDGWYFTAGRNGSLRLAVGEALQDLANGVAAPTQRCDECDDTGETGDWMNRHPCGCLWWKDPGAARKAFVAQLKNFADCDHGVPGGDMKAPNGWQHCSICRGPGWVDKNSQGRTDEKSGTFKRSTSVLRAEQALAVADQLDRKYGHGKYAPGLTPYGHHNGLEQSA